MPEQADTFYYFDERFIVQMRKPFILINTSRGSVVNIAALLQGLATGKVLGACLDVFEQEPLGKMGDDITGQLTAAQNVVVTPHIAGYTFEALYKMSRVLLQKITGC